MDPLYGQRTTHTKAPQDGGKWVIIDATDKIMGRLASRVASILLGKTKPQFMPGVVAGDRVIIINAANVKTTGDKVNQKLYHWHSGYFGGLKTRTMKKQMEKVPDKILYEAIKGMLPKNTHGRKLLTRVRIFQGNAHGMDAQKPEMIQV
ncbi:MAG: 50S ribosomal protein L13 [Spirochaetia bacterium]|nr:50S ribosomal protein L13 [Spirochaetia bacterium]